MNDLKITAPSQPAWLPTQTTTNRASKEDEFGTSSLTTESGCFCSIFSAIGSFFCSLFHWISYLCGAEEPISFLKALKDAYAAEDEAQIAAHLEKAKQHIDNLEGFEAFPAMIKKGTGSRAWRQFVRFFIPHSTSLKNREAALHETLNNAFATEDKRHQGYYLAVATLLIHSGVDHGTYQINGKSLYLAAVEKMDGDLDAWVNFMTFLRNRKVNQIEIDNALC